MTPKALALADANGDGEISDQVTETPEGNSVGSPKQSWKSSS